MITHSIFETEFGSGLVIADEDGILAVELPGEQNLAKLKFAVNREKLGAVKGGHGERTADLLGRYYRGENPPFDLPIDMSRFSPFRRKVYREVMRIPYGKVATYGEIAMRIGVPGGARGVGTAMACNPIPIIIPCHRVVAAKGRLGGFSGGDGIMTKRFFLQLEGVLVD